MSLVHRKTRLHYGERAFSLVEVAIAFGILSFAMITLIGLLPMALTTLREVKRDTVHANILQYVAATANLTPFTNMVSLATGTPQNNSPPPWTFDDQGEVLSQGATTNASDTSPAAYKAYISVTSSPISPSSAPSSDSVALLPGASALSTNTYLLTVEIVDTDQPNRPTTNTIVTANMGK